MIEEIGRLLVDYSNWLRDRTSLRQIQQWVEITTPYLDRHNDYMQIYVRKSDHGYILTDDGYILADLEHSGCKLTSNKRQDLLKMTLNGFGVQQSQGTLQVHATPENFAARKHSLVQAMLAVNDMFYLSVPVVASIFLEDVVEWLDLHEVRYTPKVKFTGKTGFDHLFDFVVPKSRLQPERIIHTLNRPNRNTAQAVAFAWIDTREVRPPESKAYALLNDSFQAIPSAVYDALRQYDVRPIPWSRREDVIQELAA